MKLHELVTDAFTEYTLDHPMLDKIKWIYLNNEGCFLLVFAEGMDKNQPLVVDDTVLISDQWTLLKEGS